MVVLWRLYHQLPTLIMPVKTQVHRVIRTCWPSQDTSILD